MTSPEPAPRSTRLLRASVWVAIGALIAAAIVCVVWVLIGDDNGIVGRAFLTILLLVAFAGVAIAETNVAARRPAWLALASMVSWVVVLLVGAFLIWMPAASRFDAGAERFFSFLVIILIVQGVLLHVRLFLAAYERYQTTFTTIVAYVTIGLVVILAAMLVLPLMTHEYVTYRALYWRVVVALAILAAVGTALVPLVNALFAPKRVRPAFAAPAGYQAPPVAPYAAPVAAPYGAPAYPAAPAPWPTYSDAITPLPALPDGTPDWNAYYTGRPSAPTAPAGSSAAPAAPAPQGYQGYPPAPPLPPQN
ncbi:hypothetical protein [Microbacterium dextranolyticum]|uniref:Uncharacterized protein n=1 Tax=Microbacterium dextranolyticum TaxID=36806 RepID=A0A9W6M546_9MICO|nr:hypothetical protein [Microbacterium dextranolyticum]MBM7463897.1 hypothetical protein [Microbacterium dextranolyticum]GLJ94979.1 hypothetical protein GCM10017591_10410 [Microbacterium dextranolyticum]